MKTIAAISTPQGVGGIGIVRISGENAIKIADKVFKPYFGSRESRLEHLKGYTAKYGKVIDRGEFIDDAIALVFKAPNSYTGENVVEISCHGGLYLTRKLLRVVVEAGAVIAEPGEFTKRAFLNGKMDLSQAEAVMDLISAKGERANKMAFSLKEGTVSKKINEIKNVLIDTMANLSVWADYPEEDIPQIDENLLKKTLTQTHSKILKMIDNYDACKILKEGVKTAIIGRPNVGKSTLMNLLSGQQKSIVTDIPGTTRDIIEETVMLGDIPLLLVDTAGIRETEDVIEKIGVEKAKSYMNISDITLLILDASSPLSDKDLELLNLSDKSKTIIILNKCDLGKKAKKEKLLTFSDKIVELSAISGKGIDDLKNVIENVVGLSNLDPADAIITTERQLNSLKDAEKVLKKVLEELEIGVTLDAITVLLQDATQIFMEFTGESVSEAVIDKVFSKFCIGK